MWMEGDWYGLMMRSFRDGSKNGPVRAGRMIANVVFRLPSKGNFCQSAKGSPFSDQKEQ
jgi:hypothetical protein